MSLTPGKIPDTIKKKRVFAWNFPYRRGCFCDNFEWIEGNSARSGLVSADPETRQQQIKKSGKFYSEIIRRGGADQELYDTYVAREAFDLR